MSEVSVIYIVGLYAAGALFLAGVLYRMWEYARTPQPFAIPTTPAPTTRWGVVRRMAGELTLFVSLFRASRWTWWCSWLFHLALGLVLIGHFRFFTAAWWSSWPDTEDLKLPVAWLMVVSLAGLWSRRLLVDRVRYISTPADHLMLGWIVGIALSGLWLSTIPEASIEGVRRFVIGMLRFDWRELPAEPAVLVHLALVAGLLAIFPFSKLLHAPGVLFSPTRAAVDNPRERGSRRG